MAVIGAMSVLAACGGSSPSRPNPTTTNVPVTSAPTTSAGAAATTTTAPALHPQPSPDAAANALINAWHGGDRTTASYVAVPGAVSALFAQPVQSTSDRGCQEPLAGRSSCAFGYGSGLIMLQTVNLGAGWFVKSATFDTGA